MESKARIFGHSVHQMLIVFPLGLLATAVIFDTVFLITHRSSMATVAYWAIVAGVIGGLVSAPFGLIDWLAVPRRTRAWRVGLAHGVGNLIVLILFGISWWLRADDPQAGKWPASALSYGGVALALITAWLGGELVSRLGVGVYDGANLDAPNSLSDQPARGDSRAIGGRPAAR